MVEGPSCGTLTFSVSGHPVSHALWYNISIILVCEKRRTRQFLVVYQVSLLPELFESVVECDSRQRMFHAVCRL